MKRHAIFVDAGYVFAQGSVSLLGKSSERSQLTLNGEEILVQLKALAASQSSGVEILRVYWYDGARNGPTLDHLALANMSDVKLRLGSINSYGKQKEVDSLLITDLIDLARNQAICNATVVAGDSDVRIAVQIAQSFGVRVHLIGLEPSKVSQSPLLRQEADTVHEISRTDVSKFLSSATPALAVASSPSSTGAAKVTTVATATIASKSVSPVSQTPGELGQIIDEAIQRTLASATSADLEKLSVAFSASEEVPPEFDRPLLGTCRSLLGRELTGDERRQMRTLFVRKVLVLAAQMP